MIDSLSAGLRSRVRNWPIRRKLIANSLVTSSIALLLAGLLLAAFELRQTRLDVANELTSIGEMLGVNVSAPLIFNDQQAAEVAEAMIETLANETVN